MPHDLTLAILGSVAATLFAILGVLRFNSGLKLAVRWVRARAAFANSLMITLAGASAATFFIGDGEFLWSRHVAIAEHGINAVAGSAGENNDEKRSSGALEALRANAARIANKQQSIAALSEEDGGATANPSVPDVDTMIARLAQRLEASPNDVKGWTMLGWSYLNTQRPADAVKAYERALQIEPESAEIREALNTAKQKLTPTDSAQQTGQPSLPGSASAPGQNVAAHPNASAD